MCSKLHEIEKRYTKLLESIPHVEESLDYSILDKHIPYLEKMDSFANSAISVFDMFKKTHVYVSPSYRNRLGLSVDTRETTEGFEKLMPPNDQFAAAEAGYCFLKMSLNIKGARIKDYKLINEYRIGTEKNGFMRMKEQYQILETDADGNIWLSLSIIDVSPNQNADVPMQSRFIDQQTGEVLIFPTYHGKNGSSASLTTREKQILQLIAKGYVSKQIAADLYISPHTVNTHRQNIIEKMDVANTTEAILLASQRGMLD